MSYLSSRCTRCKRVCRIRVFCPTRRVRRMFHSSLALTDGLLISVSLFMVSEIFLAPKMSIAVHTGDSNPCRYTRRTRHTVATCLVADVCDIATTLPYCTIYIHILWPCLLSGSRSHDNVVSRRYTIDSVVRTFRPAFKHDIITI